VLVSRRYERGSIVVTSNRSFEQWGEILGDAMVAAALIDRLVHHAEIVTLKGKSYRLRERAGGVASALVHFSVPKVVHFSVPVDTRRHLAALAADTNGHFDHWCSPVVSLKAPLEIRRILSRSRISIRGGRPASKSRYLENRNDKTRAASTEPQTG
jgi:IstB-like ATP binding protein